MQEKEFYIDVNGTKQNVLVLYEDISNPILLIAHGGPGSPDRPLVHRFNSPLTKHFTVVCWDQRGAGLSYTEANTKEKLTVDLMLSDLQELVLYLIRQYHQDKIYLAGHSWGAYLGLRFTKLYPQYIKYYIGTGQGISSFADEIEKYNFVLQKATAKRDEKAIRKLQHFGTPVGMTYPNDTVQARDFVGKLVHKYGGYIHPNSNLNMLKYVSLYLQCYGKHILQVLRGINYSVQCLNPEINKEDKISKITSLDVPILLISGERDFVCPVQTTKRWFDNLQAPAKDFVIIENAAHMVNFEQPDAWNQAVIQTLKG